MEKLLNDLNPRQIEAVRLVGGPLLIVAGAGSGKTRVITYKIAYLIANNIASPDEITAVTFTNKAAGEMKSRVRQLLTEKLGINDYYAVSGVTVSTFHSYCAGVLRQHVDRLGISRDFVIYDSDDQKTLISKLMDEHNIDKKQFTPRDMVSYFSSVKNGTAALRPNSNIQRLYDDYEKELRKAEALDFGDLLRFTVKLFSEHKDVLEIYQDRAKYLFVDEYQDTNRIQYKLIRFLSLKHGNICVVGDEDQSIYKWRGADIRNILDFEKDYTDSSIVKLEENYRSTKNIINASSTLIEKNFQRKGKTLFTSNSDGEKIKVATLVNDIRESEYITSQIAKRFDEGFHYDDMAIFYRINAQSRLIEEHLRRAKIPYKIVGGIRFYDRKEIRDIISYLRLIINPHDSVSLARIINVPSRGIGKTTLEKLDEWSRHKNISLYSSLLTVSEIPSLSPAAKAKLTSLVNLFEELRVQNSEGSVGSGLLRILIEKIQYFEYLKEKSPHEADERIDNVSELMNAMADFEENSGDTALEVFLESVSLIGDTDLENGDNNGVKLMTLHSAKGLEFPVVFVQGLEYGLLPYIRYGNGEQDNDVEEERRLLYVGMTRAKEILYLSWARSRRIFGGIKARYPSKFLDEIKENYVEHYKDTEPYYEKTEIKPKVSPYSQEFYVADETPQIVGHKVMHATYGEGIVRAVDGSGDKARVTVQFRNYGTKKLLWGFANLMVVS
ncbi:MAG: UvrD-helicase domain-containing protein [Oligoflexia bacterium]|nr:UvrD-helicase domain-containing protein [Oligoflexia bacterium]